MQKRDRNCPAGAVAFLSGYLNFNSLDFLRDFSDFGSPGAGSYPWKLSSRSISVTLWGSPIRILESVREKIKNKVIATVFWLKVLNRENLLS